MASRAGHRGEQIFSHWSRLTTYFVFTAYPAIRDGPFDRKGGSARYFFAAIFAANLFPLGRDGAVNRSTGQHTCSLSLTGFIREVNGNGMQKGANCNFVKPLGTYLLYYLSTLSYQDKDK